MLKSTKSRGSKIGLRPLGVLLHSTKVSLSSVVLWPLHAESKNSSMALQPDKEPGLAELPLIADAMVAAGLPHGAGLDAMARIEDTSSSVREAVDVVGRPQAALLEML